MWGCFGVVKMKKIVISFKCHKCNKELYVLHSESLEKEGMHTKNFIYHKQKYWCKECFY